MNTTHTKYPNRIERHRKIKGLSKKQLAVMLGIKNQFTITQWEDGTSIPNLKNLLKLMQVLEVSERELYYEYFEMTEKELEKNSKKFSEKHNRSIRND